MTLNIASVIALLLVYFGTLSMRTYMRQKIMNKIKPDDDSGNDFAIF